MDGYLSVLCIYPSLVSPCTPKSVSVSPSVLIWAIKLGVHPSVNINQEPQLRELTLRTPPSVHEYAQANVLHLANTHTTVWFNNGWGSIYYGIYLANIGTSKTFVYCVGFWLLQHITYQFTKVLPQPQFLPLPARCKKMSILYRPPLAKQVNCNLQISQICL